MCCYPFAETLELYTGRIWSLLLELLKYFLLHRTICKYRGHKGQLHNFYMSFHAILPTLDCRGNQFFISPMKATIIILLKKKNILEPHALTLFFFKRGKSKCTDERSDHFRRPCISVTDLQFTKHTLHS